MAVQRPTAVLVIAILQLVFGSIGLICSLCNVAGQAAQGQLMQGNNAAQIEQRELEAKIERGMEERFAHAKLIQYGQIGLDVVLSVLMIVSGLGLLQLQSWGRQLAICYGVLSLLAKAIVVPFTMLVVMPVTQEVLEEMPVQPGGPDMGSIMGVVAGATAFFQLAQAIYPVTVLIFMFTKPVRDAFSQAESPGMEPGGSPPGPSDYRWRE